MHTPIFSTTVREFFFEFEDGSARGAALLLRFETFRKHPRGRINYDHVSKRETLFRGSIKIC